MRLTVSDFIRSQWTTVPPVVKADLSGKTVIVTGANVGIGLETAKHFARMGPGKLIVTCRSKEKGREAVTNIQKETGCETVEAWVLDLADFSSVKMFCERFNNEGGRLDILLENAAIAALELEFTKDGWESSTQVNDLSPSLLALLLLPRMLDTAQRYNTTPRIVVVSSETHYRAGLNNDLIRSPDFFRKYAHKDYLKPPLRKRYPETKLLNILFVRALNDRLHRKPIIVNAPNPGYCYSSLRRNFAGPLAWGSWLMELALARTAEQGSRQAIWAAVGVEEKKDELRGAYISLAQVHEPSDFVVSEEGRFAQNKLWDDLIEELTKLEPRVQKIVKEHLTEPALE